jgi:hypothetical protein
LTVTAQVTLLAEELEHLRPLGTFAVLNLSAGGVLVAGQAPERAPRKLTAILELGNARPLRAEARIVRVDRGGAEATFALDFTRLSASGQDALQTAVLNTLEEARAASVLIVAPPTGVERGLARDLRHLGRPSFHVGSVGEAMRFFELQNSVNLAFVDERLDDGVDRQGNPASAAPGGVAPLLAFLADAHPDVMRVVFSAAPPGHARAATSLLAEVELLLHAPASAQELRRLLQLRPHRRASAPAPEAPATRLYS